jgi:hypothetical protein
MLRELFLKTDKMLFFSVLVKKKFLFLPKRVPGKRQMLTGQPELGKERKRKKKM